MKAFEKLKLAIEKTNSILCVGLDTDISKLPDGISKDFAGMVEFNKAIIDATKDIAPAFKINYAFYEQYGIKGFEVLEKTMELIPEDSFVVADAKRGDIGNTSKAYAKSCFEHFNADSITVHPYMGSDSVEPFLSYEDKMVFVLGLTSNKGSKDFQYLQADGKTLYRHVIETTSKWASFENIGYVVGATHPSELAEIREVIPQNCLLIPGVGAQGGDVEAVIKANAGGPAIINASRGVIYASSGEDFADKAREAALNYRNEFNKYM